MLATRDLEPRDALGIVRRRVDGVAPPYELGAGIAEREEDDDGGEGRAGVHRCLREVWPSASGLASSGSGVLLTVVSLPPREGALPDKIVEEEAEDEPEGILRCRQLRADYR